MKLFSIYDVQAKFFAKPVVFSNRGEAISSFSALCSDSEKKTPHSQFPADFELFEIATFNDETGFVVPLQSLVRLGSGLDLARKPS